MLSFPAHRALANIGISFLKNAKQTNRKKLLITSWCLMISQLQIWQTASGLLNKNLWGELFKVLATVTHAWKGWFIPDLGICILNLFLPLIGRGELHPVHTLGSFLCLEIQCFLKHPTEWWWPNLNSTYWIISGLKTVIILPVYVCVSY